MKKLLLLLVFSLIAATVYAETIFTIKDFRGHQQGMTVDESSIYSSFTYEIVKFDFTGKVICRIPAPFHSGDLTTDGKKLYCAVALRHEELIKKHGAPSCIFIYNKNLELLEIKPLPHLSDIDGIAYLKGKFYLALNDLGSARRMENRIAILDSNFNVLKIATVTIGSLTRFGAQTLNPFNGKLLAGFYGGRGNSFIFDPDELENSTSTVKPIGSIPADTSVGFSELPAAATAAPGKTFIVARNTRAVDPVSKRRKSGVKFLIQQLDKAGKLVPASLK